jgi:hypothetical protein
VKVFQEMVDPNKLEMKELWSKLGRLIGARDKFVRQTPSWCAFNKPISNIRAKIRRLKKKIKNDSLPIDS